MADIDPKKLDFDTNTIPAEAPDGDYTATCKRCKALATKDGDPMLILELGDLQPLGGQSVDDGAEVTAFVVLTPASGDKKSHIRGLRNLKALLAAASLPPESGNVRSPEDFEALRASLEGAEIKVNLKSAKNRKNEMQVNVNFG